MLLKTSLFYQLCFLFLLISQTGTAFAYDTQGRRGSDNIEDRRGENKSEPQLFNLWSSQFYGNLRKKMLEKDQTFVDAKNIANHFYTNCMRTQKKLLGDEKNTMALVDDLGKMLSHAVQFHLQPTPLPEKKEASALYRNKLLARKMFFCIDKRIDESPLSPEERKELKGVLYLMMTLELNKEDVRKLQKTHLFSDKDIVSNPPSTSATPNPIPTPPASQ